jgi:alpha-tubulin suppressor-like RCC1 family protein
MNPYNYTFVNGIRKIPLTNVKKIYCGNLLKYAITESNELYTCVYESPKKIMSGVKDVLYSSYIITLSDEIYALDDGKEALILKKVSIPNVRKIVCKNYSIAVISTNNNIYCWSYDSPSPIKLKLSNVKDISLGLNHAIVLTHNHQIYSWGNNSYGQLEYRDSPKYKTLLKIELNDVKEVICNKNCSFAITNTNELYAWGLNDHVN